MISYTPLWETMKRNNATTYTLRNKGNPYVISGGTMERLKKGLPISTTTIDTICKILNCDIHDIIKFIPD